MLIPTAARAHGDDDVPALPTLPRSYAAPTLKTFVQPVYPAEAMRLEQGGVVILALQITLEGDVASATVKRGVGPLFDEAALAAGWKLKFHPGKLDGRPVSTSIDFEYRFSAPGHTHTEAVPLPPTHLDPADAQTPLQIEGVEEVTIEIQAERPLTAASARTVRDRDLRLRPILRPGDLFRVTPGLMLVQHAGGGKATQFLLRGFDADHGTDIALSFDGIPINMVSHGHGQGYADANFVIPELVERVEVSKGPYFTENGDFSTAGSINLVTRNHAESFASFGGGSFDTLRSVAIAAPRVNDRLAPVFAAEIVRTNGPFQNPEGFTKLNLYTKLTYDIDDQSTLSFGASQYNGSWNASGQLPSRAVKAGQVDFFGSLDPTEGGTTDRQNVFVAYRLRPDPQSEFRALAYLTLYDFRLYSNFTFYSRDPINGDQIEQRDNRTVHGARASYRWLRRWHGLVFDSALGGDARADDIANGLSYNRSRERLSNVVDANIQESSVGVWAKEEVQVARWLRVVGGVRADHFTFQVNDALEDLTTTGTRSSGTRGASQVSPKASVIVSPHRSTDLFLNFGYGFHSNDARGVVRSVQPVTPLTRTVGYEVGARTRLLGGRVETALALWGIDVASETVWIGDEGVTEAGGATRRLGIEWEGRWEIQPWLFADADVTVADAKYRDNAGNGNAVALAPRLTASGGVSAFHSSGVRGSIRGLHIAERPATEDKFLTAEATTVLDAFVAYRWRSVELAVNLENMLNQRYKAAQFATVTRVAGEAPGNAPPPAGACPAGTRAAADSSGNFQGCEDVSFSPGNPFNLRITGTYYF
ncbi:MAG: TonB family protein [Deltaproteobacteria bacterium]|nr:TonB family protein [Deltaproteobacteria bacterium]